MVSWKLDDNISNTDMEMWIIFLFTSTLTGYLVIFSVKSKISFTAWLLNRTFRGIGLSKFNLKAYEVSSDLSVLYLKFIPICNKRILLKSTNYLEDFLHFLVPGQGYFTEIYTFSPCEICKQGEFKKLSFFILDIYL